jgi:drug/metabolite transporter (DMT)-like permease
MGAQPQLRAYLALGLGILIIGSSAILIRLANAPGVVTAFYRMGIAAAVMAPPFYRHIRRRALVGKEPLPKKGLWIAALAGGFFALDLAFWASGVMLSGAASPTLLANTAPLWVGLGAWLIFGERQRRLFWLGLGLAMLGATIVLGQELARALDFGLGTFLGLLAAIGYGAYQLTTQRGRALLDTLSFFWISAFSASLCLLLLVAILGEPLVGYSNFTYLNFLAIGLVVQVVGWLVINYAQGFLPAAIVAPTLLIQPLITAILAGLLLGETFTVWHILGGAAVLAGVFSVHRSRFSRLPS